MHGQIFSCLRRELSMTNDLTDQEASRNVFTINSFSLPKSKKLRCISNTNDPSMACFGVKNPSKTKDNLGTCLGILMKAFLS